MAFLLLDYTMYVSIQLTFMLFDDCGARAFCTPNNVVCKIDMCHLRVSIAFQANKYCLLLLSWGVAPGYS